MTDKNTISGSETDMDNTNEDTQTNVVKKQSKAGKSPFDEIQPENGNDDTAREPAMNVPMVVQVVVGKAEMTVREVMGIRRGAVVELDRKAGDVVDIVVNGKTLAKGELTVFEDGRIGVTLVEIVRGTM